MNMPREIQCGFLVFVGLLWSLFSIFGFRLHTCHMHIHVYKQMQTCTIAYIHTCLHEHLLMQKLECAFPILILIGIFHTLKLSCRIIKEKDI